MKTLLILLFTLPTLANTHIDSKTLTFPECKITLADIWRHDDHIEIGTVLIEGNDKSISVCHEMKLYDEHSIEGPTFCSEPAKLELIDLAVEVSEF